MTNEFDGRRLEAFLEFVAACARVRDRDAFLGVLAERAHELLEFERLNILLCDDNRQIQQVIRIQADAWREIPADEMQLSEMDMVLQVLLSGGESGGTAGMCTRMESAGRMMGVLCLAAGSEEYTNQDLRLVHFLADCLGGTFERLAQNSAISDPAAVSMSAADAHKISSASHAMSLRMSYLAQHDALTDLPNRLLLDDRIARALALARRYGRPMAVLFLDLDRFKQINDSLGHSIGDQVLREVSHRLVRCVRSSDTVSRIGGDEFVVLLAELEHAEDAAITAGRIIASVSSPLNITGREVHVTLSIGASVYPGDGEDAETLIKNADTAMYHAKAEGPGRCQFFRRRSRAAYLLPSHAAETEFSGFGRTHEPPGSGIH